MTAVSAAISGSFCPCLLDLRTAQRFPVPVLAPVPCEAVG